MFGCGLQWKGCSPGSSGAVKVTGSPLRAPTSKAPSSAVTVWKGVSSLTTVIVAPGGTEGGTSNVKSEIAMTISSPVSSAAGALL